jgi:glycosyltransferase involved in cell wall biosynthesis
MSFTTTSMRLGLGATALAKSIQTGHADGIGTYTGELLQNLQQNESTITTRPVVFGAKYQTAIKGCLGFPWVYSINSAATATTALPFRGAAQVESGIDLFHATDHFIPKLRRTPVVATVMDVIGLRHPEWVNPRLRSIKNALFKKAVGWADHLITISDFSANDIADAFALDRSRITSIPLGVNPAFFDRVSDEDKRRVLNAMNLQPGFFIVVGTLQPRKNIERIVQAHGMLAPSFQKAHPLVVVGQQGWRSEAIRDKLAQLEAKGTGRWLQYVKRQDLYALLQSAQALVFPSLYEGFGLPVLEGFASGVPVISSTTTSVPEVAGDAALLVDPLRADHLSHALQQAIEDTDGRARLIAKGYTQAQRFTWAETAKQTAAVYNRYR